MAAKRIVRKDKDKLISELQAEIERLKGALTVKIGENKELEALSTHDRLTGLLNRHGLDDRIKAEISRLTPPGTPEKRKRQGAISHMCFLLLDADNFKRINDAYGHKMGDEVLKHIGAHLRTRMILNSHPLRTNDIVGRWGGEEFLIVLPGATKAAVADRIMDRYGKLRIEVPEIQLNGITVRVTLSGGLVEYIYGEDYEAETIDRADTWLRAAKETGRNQILVAA